MIVRVLLRYFFAELVERDWREGKLKKALLAHKRVPGRMHRTQFGKAESGIALIRARGRGKPIRRIARSSQ
jgi:hypothetical protein